MLKANGIVPATTVQTSRGVKREAEDVKPQIIDIEDGDEIEALEVSPCYVTSGDILSTDFCVESTASFEVASHQWWKSR